MIKASLQEASTIEEQSLVVVAEVSNDVSKSISLVCKLHNDVTSGDKSDGLADNDGVVDSRDVGHDVSPVG